MYRFEVLEAVVMLDAKEMRMTRFGVSNCLSMPVGTTAKGGPLLDGYYPHASKEAIDLLDEDSIIAHTSQLSNRLPYIYAVVAVNASILAYIFQGTGPLALNLLAPLLTGVLCLWRSIYWLPKRCDRRPLHKRAEDLDHLSRVGMLVTAVTAGWSLSLYGLGDVFQQSIVQYVVAVTAFTGILGLSESPRAAVTVATITIVPSSIVFTLSGHPNALPITIAQIVVAAMLLLITFSQNRDFLISLRSKRVLKRQQSDAQNLAEIMREQSLVDLLTGCPNRKAILDAIEVELKDEERQPPWIGLLDLDGFKAINDTFGHAEGDVVLKHVVERIRRTHGIMHFGRLGGDEFALLLSGDKREDEVFDTLEGLIENVGKPIETGMHKLSVTASIGLRKTARLSINECLERADTALYRAKAKPGRVVAFRERDETELTHQRQIARMVASSNFEKCVDVEFQPIVDFDRGGIIGIEALARWLPAKGASILPADFVAKAEASGRMSELTELVINRSLDTLRSLPSHVSVQINLVSQDLLDGTLHTRVMNAAERAHIDPSRLVFEVTETSLISNMDKAGRTLSMLAAKGFRVALDDFGTGYSSLTYVHRFPVHQIKVDRTFAKDLATDRKGEAIVSTILMLTRQLGIDCVIEGMERYDQVLAARQLGLRQMQGFYFGIPMQSRDIKLLVREQADNAVGQTIRSAQFG